MVSPDGHRYDFRPQALLGDPDCARPLPDQPPGLWQRSTVRRAIAVLVEEEPVSTVPQRGTFRK
ncbi:helix-turn-helix domain-containing protein [Nocardiopsis halotolerans]|uniref:hypothetical protein n=1 Tax=Nocardiopsis halotolerans TaxID=124252 RepID=UPI000344F7A7|nr:hypothetical protein [Nocardiopsis halotolerans]